MLKLSLKNSLEIQKMAEGGRAGYQMGGGADMGQMPAIRRCTKDRL